METFSGYNSYFIQTKKPSYILTWIDQYIKYADVTHDILHKKACETVTKTARGVFPSLCPKVVFLCSKVVFLV